LKPGVAFSNPFDQEETCREGTVIAGASLFPCNIQDKNEDDKNGNQTIRCHIKQSKTFSIHNKIIDNTCCCGEIADTTFTYALFEECQESDLCCNC
jgi:hypothetical protein